MTRVTKAIQPEEIGELTLAEGILSTPFEYLLLVTIRLRDIKVHVVYMYPFQKLNHECLRDSMV